METTDIINFTDLKKYYTDNINDDPVEEVYEVAKKLLRKMYGFNGDQVMKVIRFAEAHSDKEVVNFIDMIEDSADLIDEVHPTF